MEAASAELLAVQTTTHGLTVTVEGAGGKGGHCRVSRARLISDPAEKFIYILSSKRKRAERREPQKQVGHERGKFACFMS